MIDFVSDHDQESTPSRRRWQRYAATPVANPAVSKRRVAPADRRPRATASPASPLVGRERGIGIRLAPERDLELHRLTPGAMHVLDLLHRVSLRGIARYMLGYGLQLFISSRRGTVGYMKARPAPWPVFTFTVLRERFDARQSIGRALYAVRLPT